MTVLDLRIAHLDECLAPELMSAYSKLLSPAEAARRGRFRFQRDQDRYVVSRALQRTVLAQMVTDLPHKLEFETNAYGKPRLLHISDIGKRLSFSLSHTDDAILLAVAMDCELGVDIENTDRAPPLEIIRGNFAEVEVQALRAAGLSAQQDALFWSIWTLKESLVKATGEGLHAPLNRFGFTLAPTTRSVVLQASPETTEGTRIWWFGQWAPTPHHLAAVSLAWPIAGMKGPAQAPQIRAKKVVPLMDECDLEIALIRSSTPLRYA
jgi:4'-phosphopantetheinyl transferase